MNDILKGFLGIDRNFFDDEFLKENHSPEIYFELVEKSLKDGFDWREVVLDTIKIWGIPEEKHGNKKSIYLISGEAFNWIRLATRIINSFKILPPKEDINNFLFTGFLPDGFSENKFKSKIGDVKFRGWQNYFYGVIVEECVIELSKLKYLKKMFSSGIDISEEIFDEVYEEIYGNTFKVLWENFNFYDQKGKRNKKYYLPKTTDQSQIDEFTYWLFKNRLMKSTPEVFASRVNEALKYLDNVKMNNIIRRSINQI
ncbi:MAG: hypothetical protein CL764_03655 [Chloroflexi bacterium]|nr:hypothetical protein [Chloroflexota bacterium]|tara:strand:- start:9182 stop:9949 length:768 start_codon:yes stop_codon:yes gene_type:complete